MYKKTKQRAFTLVELLVVIAIIGLLSTIILISTKGLKDKAVATKGLVFDKQLENVLGAYLLGKWSFDEGEGDIAYDSSGWNNHGTLVNNPTWKCTSENKENTASGTGCSLYFDGTNAQVTLSAITNVPNTFSAWLKISSTIGNGRVGNVAGNYPRSNHINWEVNNMGKPRVYWDAGSVNWTLDNVDLRTDKWVHYVFVRDKTNNKFYFYLNGVLSGTYDKVGNDTVLKDDFCIGNDFRAEGKIPFKGLIDEVKLYEKPLSFAEVQYEYYTGLDRLLAKDLIDQEEYQNRLAIK